MDNENNDKLKEIDLSKMDDAIKKLVLSIKEYNEKHNIKTNINEKQEIKRPKKKLNVELIRQLLIETKQIQENKKKK